MFFTSSGTALRIIAVISFLAGIVLSCVIAFSGSFDGSSQSAIRVVIIVGGILLSLISSEILYAFGNLCDDVERIAYQQKTGVKPPLNDNKSKTATPVPANHKWKCPECGKMNDSYTVICSKCQYQK